jgi:hypothetical protein
LVQHQAAAQFVVNDPVHDPAVVIVGDEHLETVCIDEALRMLKEGTWQYTGPAK